MCAGAHRGVDICTLGVIRAAPGSNLRSMESPAAAHSASPAELAQRLEAERGGLPFLFWRAPDGQRILTLEQARERVTVGRGPDVDIGLDADEQVSRLHAEIERIGGEWTLADDGLSRNGSFLNGERVGGRRRLADGDELRFGATIVVFRAPQPSPSSATIAAPEGSAAPRADRDPAPDPDRALAARSARAATTRPRRPTSRSPTRSSSRSTRSRAICGRCSRSSGSATCPRTRSGCGWSSSRCATA